MYIYILLYPLLPLNKLLLPGCLFLHRLTAINAVAMIIIAPPRIAQITAQVGKPPFKYIYISDNKYSKCELI